MKRLSIMVLTLVCILAICVTAQADSSTLNPGQTKYKWYSISSSPSYTVSLANNVSTGMRCNVTLSLNDLQNPLPGGKANWKYSSSVTLIKDGSNYSKTIRPGSAFAYVSGRSNQARLTLTASSGNSSVIVVIYPH